MNDIDISKVLQEELNNIAPEIDYPKLVTLDGAITYLRAKLGSIKV